MPKGFIYVLINPSMPGLAKIGKTTRNPESRVMELSTPSGVPSPFILAFQQPVSECDSAEAWVHKELERGGFRVTENREFFNAPLHEIIQVVAQSANLVTFVANAEGTEGECEQSQSVNLAQQLYELADSYYSGTDSVLQNRPKALELFEQAGAMGVSLAYSFAGSMYRWPDSGVPQDLEKAFESYKKSVALGGWSDLASIASIFLERGQRPGAQNYWEQFFKEAGARFDQQSGFELELCKGQIANQGRYYCEIVSAGELEDCVPESTIKLLAVQLLAGIDSRLDSHSTTPDLMFREFLSARSLKAREFVLQKIDASG